MHTDSTDFTDFLTKNYLYYVAIWRFDIHGQKLPCDYRLDLLVEDKVIIELKSVEELKPVHFKQLMTYLKIANKKVGILVNFNVDDLSEGIHRIAM